MPAEATCWIDASAGIAGDMIVAALIDAGANEQRVRAAVTSLGVPGLDLHTSSDRRGGFACRRVHVTIPEHDHVNRHLADVISLIDSSDLTDRAKATARRVFACLAAAEGAVHGAPAESVHFHEVGAHDALADVVGAVAALDDLGLLADGARIVCSALAAGSGTVRAQHGRLPVPVPAVVHLAAQNGLELCGGDLVGERATPTGAALAAAVGQPGPFPTMAVRSVGIGGGSRDTPDRPNITRVVLGSTRTADGPLPGDAVVVEATVDDLDPQLWPSVLRAVRAAGAWDCWTTAIIARHGRPGQVLSAICDETVREAVADAVFRHSTTIGLRWSRWHRAVLPRRSVTVRVGPPEARQEIAVKVAQLGTELRRAKPELADLEAAALALDRPIAAVHAEAMREFDRVEPR
ncbi:MAG TPA: nickel pincer cofactor biosynthesis protein LarC [Pseudonocardiaceae bacterium]|nr:nickel pincer cofactor biosynthesis protein LarC [Pseudonocardiaceae bacterium]